MRDYFCIGSAPWDEPCAQVGEPDYRANALKECNRFIRLLRKTFGPEPEGATLCIKSFSHDFGTYYEVVCYFSDAAGRKYAQQCEDDVPPTWEG
ncbi:MAG: hypothetical protein Q8R30_04735 [bacterium]|nr:hypothetical protein [bacterium]